MTRILFVCTGNICRSPTAEAVARSVSAEAGLAWQVDSAGTGAWHAGEAPDDRAIRIAGAQGYDLAPLVARQLLAEDFARFDHLVALDNMHLAHMRRFPHNEISGRISLLLDWTGGERGRDVPDPFYGEEEDFEEALALIEAGVRGLATRLQPSG